MDFTSEELAAEGFVGFLAWKDLSLEEIPDRQGVYVVVNAGAGPPEFLSRSPAGRFKGRDPTVSRTSLEAAWVGGCPLVYIGKAARLRTRLRQYRDHGQGKPVGHWGGRYIWQLSGSGELLIAWKVTNEAPRLLEQGMLAAFVDRYDQLPFANLRR